MISIENISLHFTGQRIFDDISLLVRTGERVGLIGKNGAGKSTLLKLITGEVQPDKGKIVIQGDSTIGYLPQQLVLNDTTTVREEAESAFSEVKETEHEIEQLHQRLELINNHESDEYMKLITWLNERTAYLEMVDANNIEAKIEQALLGLGFTRKDFQRPTSEFSGGWRMRIELAKILLKKPDILLLDEPTNHLDIESIEWLEKFLMDFNGALILISHDRAFLDNVTKRTVEISLGRLFDYKVNYSKYVIERKVFREQQLAAYHNQQKQIEDTKAFIERFRYKATKAVQVQARIKQLEKLDIIEIEEEDLSRINIRFPGAPRSGRVVFEARELSKNYGQHRVLDDIDIIIERGEKVAFIGKNGEGKTTLSRIIVQELNAIGEIKLGHNVKIGYYAQNQDELLEDDNTVLQTLEDSAPSEIRPRIRDILGAFLFSGEAVDKKVKVLSGGEKSRLALAKLLLEPYNFLILDEPTNHLDMRSKDILKQALISYGGTLVLVSHDREFLDGLVEKLYEFRNKKIKEYRCSIYEFLGKRNLTTINQLKQRSGSENKLIGKPASQQKISYLQRKEFQKQLRKIEKQIEQTESEIEKLEYNIATLDKQLEQNPEQDTEFYTRYQETKHKIEQKMYEWELLTEQLEQHKENDFD